MDDVTALIGTNESGKTNILLPLWKLNPAKEGEIDATSDYPRKYYNTFRNQKPQPTFITAIFDVGEELAQQLSELTGMPVEQMHEVSIARLFDGKYIVDFPSASPPRNVEKDRVVSILSQADMELAMLSALKSEEETKNQFLAAIAAAKTDVSAQEQVGVKQLDALLATLEVVKVEEARKPAHSCHDSSELRKTCAA